jgi:hypothetical protein
MNQCKLLETSQDYKDVTVYGSTSYFGLEDEHFNFPKGLTIGTSIVLSDPSTSFTNISTTQPQQKVGSQTRSVSSNILHDCRRKDRRD